MGNWYLPRRYLYAHRSPVTNTNVEHGTVRTLTDNTKKFIKDAQAHDLFTVNPVAINIPIFFVTNKHT